MSRTFNQSRVRFRRCLTRATRCTVDRQPVENEGATGLAAEDADRRPGAFHKLSPG